MLRYSNPAQRALAATTTRQSWPARRIKRPNLDTSEGWRARRLRYSITKDQFEILLNSQHGRCAICQAELSAAPRSIHVDHDHTTRSVRGLLCPPCNRHLGWCETRMVPIIRYLEQHKPLPGHV